MKRLKLYLLRYKKHYIAGAIFAILTSLASLFTPWILKYVIDDLTKKISYSVIIKYAGYILGISVIEGIFRFFMRKITIGASRQIEYDLRNDYFEHLQQLPLSFYDQNNTGDLMSRGTSDLNAIRMLLGPGIMYSADTITTFIFAFTMMVLISPRLSFISLIPLFFLTIFVTKMGSYLQKSHKLVQEKTSAISQASQEYLSGIKVLKSFVQEDTANEKFYGTSYDYLKANLGVAKIWGAFFPLMFFMSGLSTLIILLFGGKAVVFNEITLGELVAFHGFLSLLVWPMMAIGWVVNLFQAGIASIKRIDHVFNEIPITKHAPVKPEERIFKGKIEFKNLTFTYAGNNTPV
ncbi:MAG: ABC transporter transmembrane domain-containing protein, partial [bacterium]|nr:ABC transporter transmembrane domain-containing protein [bacterium]